MKMYPLHFCLPAHVPMPRTGPEQAKKKILEERPHINNSEKVNGNRKQNEKPKEHYIMTNQLMLMKMHTFLIILSYFEYSII